MNTDNKTSDLAITLLNAEQAAALLGCHPKTLLRKAREGAVPCFRVFGKVRFTKAALTEWVQTQIARPTVTF